MKEIVSMILANFMENDGLVFYVSSASVELGHVYGSGSKVNTCSGTGKSHRTSFAISTIGYTF
nr:hypothetical protein [uncultured Sellimonas sp.]